MNRYFRPFPFVFGVILTFAWQSHSGLRCGEWVEWPVAEGGSGHWYRLTEHGSWQEACQEAAAAGGYLGTVNDEVENGWLTETFKEAYERSDSGTVLPTGGCLAWIGHRDSEGVWGWKNGEPVVYTNHAADWGQQSGVHAYLHAGNHPDPGTWGRSSLHDDQFERNLRGIVERETAPDNVRLEQTDPNAVTVLLTNGVPIKGGELGIAYDPAVAVPTIVERGADFPESSDDRLVVDLKAINNCPVEEGVEAGLGIAWFHSFAGGEILLPPGSDQQILKIHFRPACTSQIGQGSPLRFVDCLGPAGGLIENLVFGEDNAALAISGQDSEVSPQEVAFKRGDPNEDGASNGADVLNVLDCLFKRGECPRCLDSADTNDDGQIDVGDALYLLFWRFVDGPAPAAPFATCGVDPTNEDPLGCEGFASCEDC